MRDRGAPGASVPQYRGTPGEGVFSSHQAVCAGGVSGSRRVRVSAFRRLPVPPKLAAIIGALRVDRHSYPKAMPGDQGLPRFTNTYHAR